MAGRLHVHFHLQISAINLHSVFFRASFRRCSISLQGIGSDAVGVRHKMGMESARELLEKSLW